MAFKITHQSTDPNFILFGQWIDEKIAQAEQAGDTAEQQKITAALAAKASANEGLDLGTTEVLVENNTVKTIYTRPELTVTVPEFDFYWNQWRDQFNVQVIVDEI